MMLSKLFSRLQSLSVAQETFHVLWFALIQNAISQFSGKCLREFWVSEITVKLQRLIM
jgi:hypothetical protein